MLGDDFLRSVCCCFGKHLIRATCWLTACLKNKSPVGPERQLRNCDSPSTTMGLIWPGSVQPLKVKCPLVSISTWSYIIKRHWLLCDCRVAHLNAVLLPYERMDGPKRRHDTTMRLILKKLRKQQHNFALKFNFLSFASLIPYSNYTYLHFSRQTQKRHHWLFFFF